jgi:hypothetical protein
MSISFPNQESYTVQPWDTIEDIINRIEQSTWKSIGMGIPHPDFIPWQEVLITHSSIEKTNWLTARIKYSIKWFIKTLYL